MIIRPEAAADVDQIRLLTQKAFEPMSFSDGTEAAAIDVLRQANDLSLSLVAVEEGRIVGHVAFSPVMIDEKHDRWFGLGPVSVQPELQRRGIGRSLIAAGLDRLRQSGARGCALIGDPTIYSRMGFVSSGELRYRDLDAGDVQWIAFDDSKPKGVLRFAPALE